MTQWYFTIDGEERGPVSPAELKQLAYSGELQSTDLVWRNGLPQWVSASNVRGLFVAAANRSPVPPPVPPPVAEKLIPPPVEPASPLRQSSRNSTHRGHPARHTDSAATARRFRFAPFSLALICFPLPFFSISCNNHKMLSVSGVQLITGAEFEQRDPFSDRITKKKLEPQPYVVLCASCVAVAVFFSVFANKVTYGLSAASGTLGLLLLVAFRMQLDHEVIREGQGVIAVDYEFGFLGAFFCLAIGVVLTAYVLFSPTPRRKGYTTYGEPIGFK